MWVWDDEREQMVQREITYVPGLYKIFDEILGKSFYNTTLYKYILVSIYKIYIIYKYSPDKTPSPQQGLGLLIMLTWDSTRKRTRHP